MRKSGKFSLWIYIRSYTDSLLRKNRIWDHWVSYVCQCLYATDGYGI